MSRDMTKPTKWLCEDDSDHPGHPPTVIRVFAARMKKVWVLSYPLSTHRRLRLAWAHTHFVDFVMSWLINGVFVIAGQHIFESSTLVRLHSGLQNISPSLICFTGILI